LLDSSARREDAKLKFDQSVEALKKIQSLDRRLCREVFERRFSSGRMAVDYLKIYEKLPTSVPQ
jgi:hypothetical protein